MMQDPEDPHGAKTFLESWRAEIRAGYTPEVDLVLSERLDEYLDTTVTPAQEAALVSAVTVETERFLAEERERENGWPALTTNDLLTAALRSLDDAGIYAKEHAGLSIHDGWAIVGLEATDEHRGAVFFHQWDIADALDGLPLLLAFDVCGEEPGSDEARREIGTTIADRLASFGLEVSWSGEAADRIAIAPFEWQHRRWTRPSKQPQRTGHNKWTRVPRQLEMFTPDANAVTKYAQHVYAYRTCWGFDMYLARLFRAAWRYLGGERGQPTHIEDPHTFVRAGEMTAFAPCDASRNLTADDSASMRRRAMEPRRPSRPPAPPRPWCMF
jgi:hypothetical protein